MKRIGFNCLIKALSFVLVTIFSLMAYGNDRADIYEQTVYSQYSHITPKKVQEWINQTRQILVENGLSVEPIHKMPLNKLLGLWGMSNHDIQTPDFTSLNANIQYWINYLGLDGFQDFILNTDHNDPYHLLTMNLESWKALSSFMISAGFFSEDKSDSRSLYYFLRTAKWGEGVVTSRKTKPQLWYSWAEIFALHFDSYEKLKNIFSVAYYQNVRNRDFIQRLYISLTKDLLSVVSKHKELVTIDLLVDLINPKSGLMHSSFVFDMNDLFLKLEEMIEKKVKIKGLLLTESVVKPILLDLLSAVYQKPELVNQKFELQKIILKLHKNNSSKNMCTSFLN
jgi:hypothetical protein